MDIYMYIIVLFMTIYYDSVGKLMGDPFTRR